MKMSKDVDLRRIRRYFIFSVVNVLFLLSIITYYFYGYLMISASHLFWAFSICLFVLIFVQIVVIPNFSRFYENLLVFEILYARTIYAMIIILTVPYGLFGRDVHFDYTVTKLLGKYSLQYIQYSPNIIPRIQEYSKWPMIHILTLITGQVSSIQLFSIYGYITVTKLLPVIVFSIGLLFFYLTQKKIYTFKTAVMSTLAVSFVTYNLIFHSEFVRETYAYVIFLYLIYLIVSFYVEKTNEKGYLLVFIGGISLLFAHHLTAFLFVIIIMLLNVLTLKFCGISSKGVIGFIKILSAFSLVGFLSYTLYIGTSLFEYLVYSAFSLFTLTYYRPYYLELASNSWLIIKYKLQIYLTLLYILAFCIIGTYKLGLYIVKRQNLKCLDIFEILAGIFMSLIAIANRLISNLPNVGLQRLQSFSWIFLVPPVIDYLFSRNNIKQKQSGWAYNARNVVYVGFIISFLLFNLYLIPPYLYDSNSTPNYAIGEVSMRYSASHYLATFWVLQNIPSNDRIYGDITVDELVGGLGNRDVKQNIGIYKSCNKVLFKDMWLFLRDEDFKIIRFTYSSSYRVSNFRLIKNDYVCILLNSDKVYTDKKIQLYKIVYI